VKSHQPLAFALLAISLHKSGKTAFRTTGSPTKRAGVTEVKNAPGLLGQEAQAPAAIPALAVDSEI
jgi:hypothetical protein